MRLENFIKHKINRQLDYKECMSNDFLVFVITFERRLNLNFRVVMSLVSHFKTLM